MVEVGRIPRSSRWCWISSCALHYWCTLTSRWETHQNLLKSRWNSSLAAQLSRNTTVPPNSVKEPLCNWKPYGIYSIESATSSLLPLWLWWVSWLLGPKVVSWHGPSWHCVDWLRPLWFTTVIVEVVTTFVFLFVIPH